MSLPTYPKIASDLGIPYCRGIDQSGSYCLVVDDHVRGEVAEGAVHWADRRPTRAGIRRFLMLEAERSSHGRRVGWLLLWFQLTESERLAGLVGVHLPPRLVAQDKRRLRSMLMSVPRYIPRRAEALRWARGVDRLDGPLGHRDLAHELRYRIDVARRYPTPQSKRALERILSEYPDALSSVHVTHNLGYGRLAWLSKRAA